MKCPNCRLSGAYIRRKTNEIVCRMCGVNSKFEELEKLPVNETKKEEV